MSTTPPPPPPPEQQAQGPGYGGYGRNAPNIGAIMPVPGNAEIVVYILAAIILGIVALAADDFDAHGWAVAFTWITAAYIISRGIAKASRVLER